MNTRFRRRSVLLTGVVAAGLLAAAPVTAQAAPAPGCREVALPAPAGSLTTVQGGDPSGTYLVGTVTYPPDARKAGALWRGGRFSEIDDSAVPHVQMRYHDVNSRGVVVGERMTDNSSFHTDAFTYRAGKFTFLRPLHAGDDTEALGINTRGDVVGNSSGTPVVWPAARPGTVRALPGYSRALAIDEDGTVVGYLRPYPPGTPYVWPAKGAPYALPMPGGRVGDTAVAIQNGMVAGSTYDPLVGSPVPTLWNLRTGRVTPQSDAPPSALSVNRWGTIGSVGAIVHRNGRVSRLSPLDEVTVVADTGVAAGTEIDRSFDDGQAVRWFGC
jgi:hypothetical protein